MGPGEGGVRGVGVKRLRAAAAARQARLKSLAGVRRRTARPEGRSRDMRLLPCSLKRSKEWNARMAPI